MSIETLQVINKSLSTPVTLRQATCRELETWDSLVRGFNNYRVVHTLAWIRSLESFVGGTPLFLIYEKDGEIVGCLPGLLITKGPLRLFGSPLSGWQTVSMGPVFDDNRISTQEMITALIPFLEDHYNVHYVELLSHQLDPPAMDALGFRGEQALTYRALLFPDDEERAMKGMKDSARRNIRRANKLGLIARFETEETFVDEAYDQINEVFIRGGNTVSFSKRRTLEFFRHMKAAGNLVAISIYLPDEEVCIATGLFTIEGNELLLWQWAHRTRYRWYRPTELMTWTVMQRAMEAGCETFDLMGGGQFKAKFGAQPDKSKYRWTRSRYRWLALSRDLAVKCYRVQQSVRGRLAQARLARRAVDQTACQQAGNKQ